MVVLTCYNKACSTKGKFEDNKNGPEACRFHPGGPVFHDALKGWSCCKKRVIDFGEFLAIQGCTAGEHNPVKTEIETKVDSKNSGSKERPEFTKERDSANYGKEKLVSAPPKREHLAQKETQNEIEETVMTLKPKILSSLRSELSKMELEDQNKAKRSTVLEVGWKCNKSGCNGEYAGPHNDAEVCDYHPGTPVFHEGMKFWSCCERKTSDFTSFLNQKGCESEQSHEWVHPDQAAEKSKAEARYDYHQTSDTIYCNVYCKGIIPNETTVLISDRRVDINVCFGIGKTRMSLRVTELWARIVPQKSKLMLAGSKLELGLSKHSKVPWKTLEAKEEQAQVLFGMPEKMQNIWPENLNTFIPEAIKKISKQKAKPTKKQIEKVDEDDFDVDEIRETEWS